MAKESKAVFRHESVTDMPTKTGLETIRRAIRATGAKVKAEPLDTMEFLKVTEWLQENVAATVRDQKRINTTVQILEGIKAIRGKKKK